MACRSDDASGLPTRSLRTNFRVKTIHSFLDVKNKFENTSKLMSLKEKLGVVNQVTSRRQPRRLFARGAAAAREKLKGKISFQGWHAAYHLDSDYSGCR